MKKPLKKPVKAITKKTVKKKVIRKKPKKAVTKPIIAPTESIITPVKSYSGYRHPGGRPPKWETVPQLENLINEYFESCWKQKVDMFGNPVFIKDKKGKKTDEPVMVQAEPYTITGLAVYLGCERDTLLNYEKKDKFFGTIKRAKEMCHGYAEKSLFVGKNPTGAIFNLKNNYGWRDKTETELSGNLNWKEEAPK